MADRDPGAGCGSGGAAGEEYYSWVPVRAVRLTNLLHDLGAVRQSRWWDSGLERDWVRRAAAVPDAGAGGPQPELARQLRDVMSTSWYGLSCMLGQIEEFVAESLDPALRPRPGSAAWWSDGYGDDDALPGSHGFVHLTRRQAARARGLVAGALARVRAAREDLMSQQLWPAPAALPDLLARMRDAQRLADAVLLPLRELELVVDHLVAVNGNNIRGNGGRERRRRRSAPPSRRTPAGEPMLTRSASM